MTAASDAPTAAALPDTLGDAASAFVSGPQLLLIGEDRVPAADGRTFPTLDPATGREIAQVAHAGSEDVDRAVATARAAFTDGPWPSMPAAGRERLMMALADAIEAHDEELAEIESLDNGTPAGRRRSRAACSPSPRPTCTATRAVNRSACAGRSCRGTFPC